MHIDQNTLVTGVMLTKRMTDTQLRSLPLSNETVDVSRSEKALDCCPPEQAQPIY